MRDIEYVQKQKEKNDFLWQKKEKYLYYSYKNNEYIFPTLVIGFLLLFVKNGILCVAILLFFVLLLCRCNNAELDNTPSVLKQREIIKKARKEMELNNQ